jgi:hypothetical protein
MALDETLHDAMETIRAIQWDYDGMCQMCGGFKKHIERCNIRNTMWNLERQLDLIND